MTALSAALVGLRGDAGAEARVAVVLNAAIAVSFTVLGVVVLVASPGHPVGRLMTAAGLLAAVAVFAAGWPGSLPLAWLSRWIWWPSFGLILLALLYFPDGRLPGPRWRPLDLLVRLGTLVAGLALAAAALDHPRTLLTTGVELTAWAHDLVAVAWVAALVTAGTIPAVLWSLLVRWRRADGETRRQVACLLPASILLSIGLVLEAAGVPHGWLLPALALPLGMAVAVLRYRLYDLDLILNRTVVWLVMSLLVVLGFVGTVAVLRDVLMRGWPADAALVATGLVAVAFAPLQRRVQRAVNRLVYGERDDPYKVIGRLGDLLGHTVQPDAVLPLLSATILRSLQVPYVAVELAGRDGPRLLAEDGRPAETVESFEMVAHGERIGRLLVATRSPHGRFTPRERRLLQDVALHAAVAGEATRLTRDLQESRERLIVAREEERRRLRRDLHDGLGPSLAGMSMQARAARRLLPPGTRVGELLDAMATDLRSCSVEVRRLVDQLRPPALDNGLAAAVRGECGRFANGTVDVRLTVDGALDGLPAAIDVAVFRIVAEALTNVTRHSGARTCQVTLHRRRVLSIEITDDGVGITGPGPYAGVGLTSMRERAEELGGQVTVGPADPQGTTIRVRLPIPSHLPQGGPVAAEPPVACVRPERR
ncbi:MAG TPA: sensor histidine kinase [Catenuloplanes sp.]